MHFGVSIKMSLNDKSYEYEGNSYEELRQHLNA